MSEKAEKLIKTMSSPLMVNGKNLLKLQPLRSKSRIQISSSETGVKIEIPKTNVTIIQNILNRNLEQSNWNVNIEKQRQIISFLYTEKELNHSKSSVHNNLSLENPIIIDPLKKTNHYKLLKKFINRKPIIKYSSNPVDNYKSYLSAFQLSNGYEIINPKKIYKYYIGSGNNHGLVNKVLNHKQG